MKLKEYINYNLEYYQTKILADNLFMEEKDKFLCSNHNLTLIQKDVKINELRSKIYKDVGKYPISKIADTGPYNRRDGNKYWSNMNSVQGYLTGIGRIIDIDDDNIYLDCGLCIFDIQIIVELYHKDSYSDSEIKMLNKGESFNFKCKIFEILGVEKKDMRHWNYWESVFTNNSKSLSIVAYGNKINFIDKLISKFN